MRKVAKALLSAAVLGTLLVAPLGVKGAEPDPSITITTDKQSYDGKEDIKATISIQNTTADSLTNVTLKGDVPEGYTVDGSSGKWTLGENDTIKVGETKDYTLVLSRSLDKGNVPVKETEVKTSLDKGTEVKTGDSTNLFLPILLVLLALAGVETVLTIKRKRHSHSIHMLLIGAALGGLTLLNGLSANAAPELYTLKAQKTIKAGDIEFTIETVLTYTKGEDAGSENGNTPAEENTETPSTEGKGGLALDDPMAPTLGNDLSYEGYTEKWADEFNGTELDRSSWNVEEHEKAWVNNELQEYVDSSKNIYVKDGKLVLKPIVEEDGRITSGRVNTMGKHDFKYGLFECVAEVPEGMGFLPAFWMMPTNENLYGQWPRCGEIDAMEVMGQTPTTFYGTIHYGNPHSQGQGTYNLPSGSFTTSYHKFDLEWEPGKITWYVDGVKVHEENDWYTATEGAGTVSYPAPFDQNFYVILNLAVGGSWVGYPDETTDIANAAYKIDYVRIYQKDSYDENVEKPVKNYVLRDADANGNYIINGNFAVDEDLTDDYAWKFLTANGGEATTDISDNRLRIAPTNNGDVDYGVQLVQADIPMLKGATYQVSFRAKADEEKTVKVAIKGPDHGYAEYMPATSFDLTTDWKEYSYEFTMEKDTDPNGRFEYELGLVDSLGAMEFTDIVVKKIAEPDPNAKEVKTVRADGNYIYNGGFNEGSKRLGYWTVNGDASVSSEGADGTVHRLILGDANASVFQDELAVPAGKFAFSIDAQTESGNGKLKVLVCGKELTFDVTDKSQTFSDVIELTVDDKDKSITISADTKMFVDNASLTEDAIAKNSSFNAGTAGWTFWHADETTATFVVDSLNEDNAADFTIKNTGAEDWKVQLKQSGIKLEEGKWYQLSFRAKSSLARQIRVVVQADEDRNYEVYGEKYANLTADYQPFSVKFQMTKSTNLNALLSICLGKVDKEINEQHRVVVDDVVLEETDPVPEKPISANENMLKNPDFEEGLTSWEKYIASDKNAVADVTTGNKSVTYSISNVGTTDWAVQLKQGGLNMKAGKRYKITFSGTATKERNIKLAMMNGNDWYDGMDGLKVEPGKVNDFEYIFTAKEDNPNTTFQLSMGLVDADSAACDITLSKFVIVCLDPDTTDTKTETPAADGNLLKNADFADGKTSWTAYYHKEAVGTDDVSTVDAEKKSITFPIENVGTAEWNVYLKQTGLKVQAGHTYKVTFDALSTSTRDFQAAICKPSGDWHGGSRITLNANESKSVEITVDVAENDEAAAFQLNLGKMPKKDDEEVAGPTATGTLTFANFKIVDVTPASGNTGSGDDKKDDSTPFTYDKDSVKIGGGILSDAAFNAGTTFPEGWVGNYNVDGANAVFTGNGDGSVTVDIKNVGNAEWHVQLMHHGVKLEAGKTYKMSFDVESNVDRIFKFGVMSTSYNWYGGCTDDDLAKTVAGKKVSLSAEFTMIKDGELVSDDNADLYFTLGKVDDTVTPGIMVISNVRLEEVEPQVNGVSLAGEEAKTLAAEAEVAPEETEEPTTEAAPANDVPEAEAPKNEAEVPAEEVAPVEAPVVDEEEAEAPAADEAEENEEEEQEQEVVADPDAITPQDPVAETPAE